MRSRYYRAGPPANWPGICEVLDGQIQYYYHHLDWPTKSEFRRSFINNLSELIACGQWVEIMLDEDLTMDIGL